MGIAFAHDIDFEIRFKIASCWPPRSFRISEILESFRKTRDSNI